MKVCGESVIWGNHDVDAGEEDGCCNYGMMSICKVPAFKWIWLVDAFVSKDTPLLLSHAQVLHNNWREGFWQKH
jgi:hypothetical protein